jgi:YfiH family protein
MTATSRRTRSHVGECRRAQLASRRRNGVRLLTDPRARAQGVLVAFCDRLGGVSDPPFDTLNLGAAVGDDPAAVARNRARAAGALGVAAECLATSRQVHGADVVEVAPGLSGVVAEADGLVARAPGPVLTMLTADCAAVVVAGSGGVAILHAGWRGLVAGTIERGVAAVGGAHAAWVGPAVRACCYEVGPEVTDAFRRRGLPTAAGGRVDIGEAAAAALRAAGVGSIAAAGVCTACSPRYFSARRGRVTGRQGAFVALLEESA